jgi:hypothetical protein
VRVSAPRRSPVEQHVRLGDGERALVQVALPAEARKVRIDTVPAGATVYVNGVLQIGQTPLDIEVSDDEFYAVRLEKNGFELTTRAITPDDTQPTITVNLLPENTDRGTLMLDSDVVAEVWVDGHDSGFVSPTVFRLPAGEHQLQLRDGDEVKSAATRVRVKSGQVTQLTLKGSK